METKEQLTLLSEIGRLDLKIIVNREKLNQLSKDTSQSEAAALELEGTMTRLTDAKNELLKRRRALDEKLQGERGNVRKWEARAEKIKGEREYTALMSEIGAQKRTITGIEAEMSEVTDELKSSEDKLKNAMSARDEKMASATRSHDSVKDLLSEEQEHLAKNTEARENLLNRIPQTLRVRYERIYERRALQGVAFLRGGVCLACMRTVPHELFNKVCKGEVIEQCPACQRFLVVEQESASS